MTIPDRGATPNRDTTIPNRGSNPGAMMPGSTPRNTATGSSSPTGAMSGVVGMRVPGEDEKILALSPDSLRCYALWWRKTWNAPMSCAGYQSERDPNTVDELTVPCNAPPGFSEYARGYARQRGVADRNIADRAYAMDPVGALNDYQVAIETCMSAGTSWRECAQHGDLIALRNRALQQGVTENTLNASLGFLGKPMEQEALQNGIRSACDMHTRGSVDCSAVANSVASAALNRSYWLLSSSGQNLQDKIEQAVVRTGSQQFVVDPQQISASAIPILHSLWKGALASLDDAWNITRAKLGMAPVKKDFATPLKAYLLSNGWSTVNSNPWQLGQTKVWLLGTNLNPMTIDPGSVGSTSWPWAASFQNWNQDRATVRGGLFTLYALLRIDPLQQALRQGLRDIAVMIIDEQLRGR